MSEVARRLDKAETTAQLCVDDLRAASKAADPVSLIVIEDL